MYSIFISNQIVTGNYIFIVYSKTEEYAIGTISAGYSRHREKYLSQQIGKLPTKSYLHIWTLQKFVH